MLPSSTLIMQGKMTNQTKLHPSGLTWERWHWPFKTQAEREMIMRWMALTDLNNGTIPF